VAAAKLLMVKLNVQIPPEVMGPVEKVLLKAGAWLNICTVKSHATHGKRNFMRLLFAFN